LFENYKEEVRQKRKPTKVINSVKTFSRFNVAEWGKMPLVTDHMGN